jgi:hypothetical protein
MVFGVGVLVTLALLPASASAEQFFSASGAIDSSDAQQTNRPVRTGIQGSCSDPEPVQAVATGTFRYDKYEFVNQTLLPLCVTFKFTSFCTTGDLYSVAYVPTFNSNDVSSNAINNLGMGPPNFDSYSFRVPPGAPFAVNLHETSAGQGCNSYAFALTSDNPFNPSDAAALADTTAPNTTIKKGPAGETEKEKAKFKFRSSEPGSTFECKLDGKSFKKCSSPKTFSNLDAEKHKFKVRATDPAGNTDPSPAKRRWEVVED